MNVNLYNTMAYKNFIPLAGYKNKPNQTQFKPNSKPISKKPKMNLNTYHTIDYNNKTYLPRIKNKPKQSQNKPNFKPCPERIEFTLSVIEGNGPILKAMNVNFYAEVYYESKPTFAVPKGRPNNPKLDITTAWSYGARIVA